MKSSVRFVSKDQLFFSTLRKRVNAYFKENNISKFGNTELTIKTVTLLSVYLLSYLAILFLNVNAWIMLIFALLMGVSMSGIGMSVMHDALHRAYSKKVWVNKLMGNTIYLLGGNSFIWNIQHNVLHHTYTNIHGMDEDIGTKAIIRLSHQEPLRKIHRYQHIYVFFLYGFMTLKFLTNDFTKLLQYYKSGMANEKNGSPDGQYIKMIGLKVLYLFFMIALPIMVTSLLWWQVLIGFLLMHMTAGYILSIIFQMAHIVEGADQPMPNAEGHIENAWAIHQLQTTSNFSKNSRVLNWFAGGLNFQIEHHLFPNISHVHYRKISEIVKKTAEDFQLPYNVKPTLFHALQSHVRMLKILGRNQMIQVASK